MSLPIILTGLNGALGLYSSVKGAIDASKASKKSKELLAKAKAEEEGWYKRNYYGNYLDSSAASAAMKRVENSLRRQNEQNRAHAKITGATPEYAIAQNEQALRSMENTVTNIASMDDSRKNQVDAIHRQNKSALLGNELSTLANDEKMSLSSVVNGLNIFQNALLGAQWGKEKNR